MAKNQSTAAKAPADETASDEQQVKLVSKKTGKPQIMSADEAKLHMKLHGRHFSNQGPVNEFTPDEAKEPGTVDRVLPQGSNPATENEAPATSNQ